MVKLVFKARAHIGRSRYNTTMNAELLELLRCPKCRAGLAEETSTRLLRCRQCDASYPIENGVPRFAGEGYVASFGRQWNRYDVARDEEDEATFAVKTGVHPRDLHGKRVLDAGCGGGRYARLLGRFGAKVVGVDLSAAVEKASTLCTDLRDVLIAQGDLLQLPVAEAAFDLVFSIGVLHHGPDPRKAFAEVAARVKPGGRLAVWLYRKNILPQELLNSSLRAVSTHVPARLLESFCVGLGALGSVPLLNKTLNKVANFSNHPDWVLRVCDNFDWYAPKYQSHHTVEELQDWFRAEGFDDLKVLAPAKSGRVYDWAYEHDMIIGSGVNVTGTRKG
jgi:SAM-dependent methyltransferase